MDTMTGITDQVRGAQNQEPVQTTAALPFVTESAAAVPQTLPEVPATLMKEGKPYRRMRVFHVEIVIRRDPKRCEFEEVRQYLVIAPSQKRACEHVVEKVRSESLQANPIRELAVQVRPVSLNKEDSVCFLRTQVPASFAKATNALNRAYAKLTKEHKL